MRCRAAGPCSVRWLSSTRCTRRATRWIPSCQRIAMGFARSQPLRLNPNSQSTLPFPTSFPPSPSTHSRQSHIRKSPNRQDRSISALHGCPSRQRFTNSKNRRANHRTTNQELPSESTAAINQELPSEPPARTRPDTEAVERSSRPDLIVEQRGSNREPDLTVENAKPEETANGRPTEISLRFFDPATL